MSERNKTKQNKAIRGIESTCETKALLQVKTDVEKDGRKERALHYGETPRGGIKNTEDGGWARPSLGPSL